MNADTINLLKECNAGCKSATNSMEQVLPYIEDESLKRLIEKYNDIHIKIGDLCHQLLNVYDEKEEDPNIMAKTMAWISTEIKLRMNHETHEIADLMIDGCNMGIKYVSKYINKYKNASPESMELARKIVKVEQDFMNELLAYL